MTSTILAHAGRISWDEILLMLPVPILFVVFLVLGRRSRPRPDARKDGDSDNPSDVTDQERD